MTLSLSVAAVSWLSRKTSFADMRISGSPDIRNCRGRGLRRSS